MRDALTLGVTMAVLAAIPAAARSPLRSSPTGAIHPAAEPKPRPNLQLGGLLEGTYRRGVNPQKWSVHTTDGWIDPALCSTINLAYAITRWPWQRHESPSVTVGQLERALAQATGYLDGKRSLGFERRVAKYYQHQGPKDVRRIAAMMKHELPRAIGAAKPPERYHYLFTQVDYSKFPQWRKELKSAAAFCNAEVGLKDPAQTILHHKDLQAALALVSAGLAYRERQTAQGPVKANQRPPAAVEAADHKAARLAEAVSPSKLRRLERNLATLNTFMLDGFGELGLGLYEFPAGVAVGDTVYPHAYPLRLPPELAARARAGTQAQRDADRQKLLSHIDEHLESHFAGSGFNRLYVQGPEQMFVIFTRKPVAHLRAEREESAVFGAHEQGQIVEIKEELAPFGQTMFAPYRGIWEHFNLAGQPASARTGNAAAPVDNRGDDNGAQHDPPEAQKPSWLRPRTVAGVIGAGSLAYAVKTLIEKSVQSGNIVQVGVGTVLAPAVVGAINFAGQRLQPRDLRGLASYYNAHLGVNRFP